MASIFEDVSINEPLPVVEVDEKAGRFLEIAGGRVVDHGDFSFVTFPAGTKRKKLPKINRPGYIHQEARQTLYKLPTNVVLTFSQHRLTYDMNLQIAS